MPLAVVGLGSNLGNRAEFLARAIEALRAVYPMVARSAVYETDPIGPDQPDYLNCAVAIETGDDPFLVLEHLLRIERELGRVRNERWGPRTIDLDLLWVEGVVREEPNLTLPHPRLRERAFALVPLLEVAPNAIDPATRTAYAELDLAKAPLRKMSN